MKKDTQTELKKMKPTQTKTDDSIAEKEPQQKDPQQNYDESTQAYFQSAKGVADLSQSGEDSGSSLNMDYEPGRFLGDYKRYSADFQDRENGAPGIDGDFGTRHPEHREISASTGEVRVESPASGVEEPDTQIRGLVLEALDRSGEVDPMDIDPEVNEGVVTLVGTVPSAVMRRRAAEIAGSILGVEQVNNHLRATEVWKR